MSLINDALKKAQKQRTGEAAPLGSMPGLGGEPAARIAKRGRPVGINSMVTRVALVGGGLVLLVIVGVVTLKIMRSRPAEPAKPAIIAVAKNESPAPAAATPAPAPAPAPAVPAADTPKVMPSAATPFVLPSAIAATANSAPPSTAPAPAPAPIQTQPAAAPIQVPVTVSAVPAATTPAPRNETPVQPRVETPPPAPAAVAVATPPPAPVRAAEPPPRMESRAVNFIESLHVTGIRVSATDAKVLMNDRVYRVGDLVEHDLGIRLTGITSSSLTFENDRGATYTRNF